MTTCPACAAPLERHVGVIETPMVLGLGKVVRVKTLGAFVACPACEFCAEVSATD